MLAAVTLEDDADDPVIAEYDVFITPELTEQLYLLQYPNRSREQPYNERHNSTPLEVRIKPKTGFMEIDISTTVYVNFDKTKGILWGEALKTAKDANINAFGMASGFGKGSRPSDLHIERHARRGGRGVQTELANFETANENGTVLNKQTLGGQIIQSEPGMPLYMLGAFRGSKKYFIITVGCALTAL
jgi:DNA-directed RNA polymerase-3 subunit RPC5